MALTLLAWVSCFVVLRRFGTWTPFAVVGVPLAIASVESRAVPRALLRTTAVSLAQGIAGGTLMVLLTHLAYAGLQRYFPSVRAATYELTALLDVVGFSTTERALLIVVIASCEEVLFRGLFPSGALNGSLGPGRPSGRELLVLLAVTVVYAACTAPLGSSLLVLCALICGAIWLALRWASGSLIVPILAHVIWDLGVLWVWPLTSLTI